VSKRGVLDGDLWSLCGGLHGWKCTCLNDEKCDRFLRFIFGCPFWNECYGETKTRILRYRMMVMWSCGSGSVWIHWIRQNLAHPKAALIKKPIPERIAKTISTIPIFFVRDIYLGPDNHFIPKRTLILAKNSGRRNIKNPQPPTQIIPTAVKMASRWGLCNIRELSSHAECSN